MVPKYRSEFDPSGKTGVWWHDGRVRGYAPGHASRIHEARRPRDPDRAAFGRADFRADQRPRAHVLALDDVDAAAMRPADVAQYPANAAAAAPVAGSSTTPPAAKALRTSNSRGAATVTSATVTRPAFSMRERPRSKS